MSTSYPIVHEQLGQDGETRSTGLAMSAMMAPVDRQMEPTELVLDHVLGSLASLVRQQHTHQPTALLLDTILTVYFSYFTHLILFVLYINKKTMDLFMSNKCPIATKDLQFLASLVISTLFSSSDIES